MVGKDLVVGFRGSSTLVDIMSDIQIGSVPGPRGVEVHKGFLNSLNTVYLGLCLYFILFLFYFNYTYIFFKLGQ